MSKINITLDQLVEYFANSSADESLPLPIRRFAAQCTVLAGHTKRVEVKLDAEIAARKALAQAADGQIAELVQHILALKQPAGTQPAQGEQVAAAPADAPADGEPQSEEDEAEKMVNNALAQAEKDLREMESGPPVTQLRPTPPNGGKPASTGDAS